MSAAPHPTQQFGPPLRDWALVAAITLAALIFGWLSVLRYSGYNAGMLDLGNMAQAIASVLRGQPLVCTSIDGQLSRLSYHVELIYLLFVPLYAIWPDPRTLLIGQALLWACGAIPAYRLAFRAATIQGSPISPRFAARCVALIYLVYPTALTSVLFDFHGDTLALPLLLFALDALDRQDWRRYTLWLALALSCKFYVAAVVVGIGALLIWNGRRRAGFATLAAALIYGLCAFFVLRPLFTNANTPTAQRGLNYIAYYFGAMDQIGATLGDRLLSAIVVFGPALPLAWPGRRWLLPALPLALAALLSTGPGGAYDFKYHHYAIVVPFIVMACAAGIARLRASRGGPALARRRAGLALSITLMFAVPLVDTPFNPLFWLATPGQGRDDSAYGFTSRDTMKDRWLADYVPPTVPIAASNFLAPHLIQRDVVYLVRYPSDPGTELLSPILPQVDFVIPDALFDWRTALDNGVVGGPTYERGAISLLLRDPSFALIHARDGLLLFSHHPQPGQALPQQAQVLPLAPAGAPEHRFADGPELLAHHIEQVAGPDGQRRMRASFTWRTARPLTGAPIMAVSQLKGVPNVRFVHLPTWALLPTNSWQPGQVIQETFELPLPEELAPGSYTWELGWYIATHPEAAKTDDRSRFGDLLDLQTLEIH